MCDITTREHEPVSDGTFDGLHLSFYGTKAAVLTTDGSHGATLVFDNISALCARVYSTKKSSITTAGRSSDVPPDHVLDPWIEVVRLCAAQSGFMRLQLEFQSHNHLVQFAVAQRAALDKLQVDSDGRIALFYSAAQDNSIRAADFETLADLGGTLLLHL